MANLSLCEILQSQLSQAPIVPGQLICCTDTGNFYRDLDSVRLPLGTDILFVDTLPLAPLSNKIYLLKPNNLYLYEDDWILLNQKFEPIVTRDSMYSFPSVGNESCIYIARDTNKTYRFNADDLHYYCIGSDYDDIKTINGGSAASE